MKLTKGLWAVGIFNAVYLLAYTLYYIGQSNYEFLLYIGVVVLLGILVFASMKYVKFDMFVLWGLSLWGLLHMLGGSLMVGDSVLYAYHIVDIVQGNGQFYILKMDQVIHFYGFMITAVALYQVLRSHVNTKKHSYLIIFLAWIGSMGLGAVNEVVEFIAFVSFTQTGVGDVYNTGLDLIFNMIGAFAGAVIQHYRR